MSFQFGCKIYKSRKVIGRVLEEKLKDYKKEYFFKDLKQPLIENTENFNLTNDGVKFIFLYDFVDSIPYRNKIQKILKTAKGEIKIIDPQSTNIYIIKSNSKIADKIKVRLSRILTDNERFIENINIPSQTIRELKNDDAVEVKFGWWKDLDTFIEKGALKGNLTESRFYNDFENSGEPTTLTFESRTSGRTIKITSKGIIIFYGRDISFEEVENYIREKILPRV